MNKNNAYNQAMAIMQYGGYLTLVFYVDFKGKTRIYGQTYKNKNVQYEHKL